MISITCSFNNAEQTIWGGGGWNGLLTERYTSCELIDGRLWHAVCQHARELGREKRQDLIYYSTRGVESVFGNCWIPTDLCPFTLDTLTMEPLVLIRWGTQRCVRWYTHLERWKQRDRINCTCLEWTWHGVSIWADEFCFVLRLWFPPLFYDGAGCNVDEPSALYVSTGILHKCFMCLQHNSTKPIY